MTFGARGQQIAVAACTARRLPERMRGALVTARAARVVGDASRETRLGGVALHTE